MLFFSLSQLYELELFLGSNKKKWDHQSKIFLLGIRKSIHLLNINSSYYQFKLALFFLRKTLFRGGKLLIIKDTEYIDLPILRKIYRSGQFIYAGKWIPGLLSNFRRFSRVMRRLEKKAIKTDNLVLKKKLHVLRFMKILPSVLFLLNSKYQVFPIRESLQLKLPSIAIVDNRLNPYIYSYAIAGNLSMRGAVNTYINIVLESCKHLEIIKKLSYKKIKFNKNIKLQEL